MIVFCGAHVEEIVDKGISTLQFCLSKMFLFFPSFKMKIYSNIEIVTLVYQVSN